MNSNFKKNFFCTLLTTCFIISNLLNLKYTTFMDLLLPSSFITYPFVILSILLLIDKFKKKDVYNSIIATVFIQVFLLIIYVLVIGFNGQSIIPDVSDAVNRVFMVDEVQILSALISFMISGYIVIYFYKLFKSFGQKFFGILLGSYLSICSFSILNILICYNGIGKEILNKMIKSNLIIGIMSSLIVVILFYILKDKDCIYTEDNFDNLKLNMNEKKEFSDKSVIEVLNIKEEKQIKKNKKIKKAITKNVKK